MVKGGKVSSKRNLRKRVRSKGGGSDDSDEDYVVSDDAGNVSDCPEDECFSLDGCAPEDSFDDFIEDEDAEEEEIQQVTKFKRSKAKKGVRSQQKNAGKTSRKRRRITCAEEQEQEEEQYEEDDDEEEEEEDDDDEEQYEEQYEEQDEEQDDEEEEEEEEEELEYEDDEVEEEEEEADVNDKDEDFKYEEEDFKYDDEEFVPEEEDYTDEEEEETRGRKKKSNGMKVGKKKPLRKRVSVTKSKGRKRSGSRVSKKPVRKRRRKNGGSRGKVQCDDADDFLDNGPTIRTNCRKKSGQKRRRILIEDANSGSDYESRPSDYEFTISEEEKEQVKEAMELCGNLRRNLRRASLRMKNEVVGVYEEDLHQQRKPSGRKGKEKIDESKGKKGKEKVEDSKSEVGKQVCGICLSEENKRRVRGVLNSCTHYFCFACIMEWSKVESRCPLCKQRFKTISKPARPTTAVDLREVVIQVPERDQVYQPTEEELRSYIDPYEAVMCSECHQGGDDGLMLLCDICDSPAHTYCVGLGREVPEGNWYCDGCRPVALASSNSQAQECVAELTVGTQSLPSRPSPVHIRESIDLNSTSSTHTSFSQGFGFGFGNLSSSRFSGRSVEGASPMSGGGAPTLSERRWIHRHIQQLRSIDRMTSTTGRINGVPVTGSLSNMHSSEIDQSREPTCQHTMTQDIGTSYHTFFEEGLSNNVSPLMQNGDPFSIRVNNSGRPMVQDSTIFSNRPVNGVIWPGLLERRTLTDYEPTHPFSSRSNTVNVASMADSTTKEESNLHIVKEQLQSMVKSHLKNLSRDTELGYSTFKDIARSSTHTILAACGIEHKKSEVCIVPPPPVCPHIELIAGGQMSMIKDCCSSCFDSFVGDVVKSILDTRMSSQWLRLGL